MAPGLLPEHIGPLVDRLREGNHQAVSLPDVAALTEVLMRSLESYFKSIDLTIYQECQSLADYIDDARLEISSLSPDHSDSAGIPRAGLELEAIVQQTESATNTIMESAERIMEADPEDNEAYAATVNDSVMQIFEACSFQDITGQRISKVVSTLEHVEGRISRLINILGVMENTQDKTDKPAEDVDEEAALLNGPALDGEGIDQAEIDDLLNDNSGNIEAIEIDDIMDADAIEESPEPVKAAPEAPPEADSAEAEAAPEIAEHASSDDIDFMFDSQSDASDGNSQDETDISMEETGEVPATAESGAIPEPETELNLIEQAKQKKAEAQAQKKTVAKPPKPVVYEEGPNAGLNPKPSGNTTQSDIDALFS